MIFIFLLLIKAQPGPPVQKIKTIQTEMKAYDLLNKVTTSESGLIPVNVHEVKFIEPPEYAIMELHTKKLKGISEVLKAKKKIYWDQESGFEEEI